MGINSQEIAYSFGQMGSAFTDEDSAVTPPAGRVIVAITFLEDTTLTALTPATDMLLDGTTGAARGYRYNQYYVLGGKHPINFLHSPSTTSSFTYKMRVNANTANQSGSLYTQVNGTGNNISRLTLMEVSG